MADDESFDELMAQSSLGSAGAQSLRDRTSPQTARLVLRIAELRELATASVETDSPSPVHADELVEKAFEQLQNNRQGESGVLVGAAHAFVVRGRFDEALEAMARAKNLLETADDWEGSAHVLVAVTALLIRAGRNVEALGVLGEISGILASHIEPVARPFLPADQLRPFPARRLKQRLMRPEEQDGPGPETRTTSGGTQQGTTHGLLLAIAAQGSSTADPALKSLLREAMSWLVYEAAAAAGLRPEEWRKQDSGDSLLAILPPDTHAPTLVATFMRHLDAGLRPFNRVRVRQAQLRLRAAVHQGAVSTDAHGFGGQAVDTTVRIADSGALRTALAEAPDACLAVGVSEAIFNDVVRDMATGIRPDEFRHMSVGKAWIWVPVASPQPPETRRGDAVDAVTPKGSRTGSGVGGMDAFTAGLLQRIRATEADLSRAREEGDDFLIEVEEAELADLRRLAAERGVEVSDRWSGRNG